MFVKNIIEFLENSAERFPSKTAFIEAGGSVTYAELLSDVKAAATSVASRGYRGKPILVYVPKSIDCIKAMLGIACSGNFYCVSDTEMPEDRLDSICKTLDAECVVTVKSADIPEVLSRFDIIYIDECLTVDEELLDSVRAGAIDTDPLYVLFTSGSTGVPKGAIVTHRNVISYTQWVCNTFDITEKTVFGSQAPFYFSMSVTDVISSIAAGGTLVIIPKLYFTFPVNLLKFMAQHSVNTIYWVPSALSLIANIKALDFADVPTLNKIMFAGEAMPVKQMNEWRRHFPNAMFANLFGPTETTDICTYYVVDREFSDGESLPIGKHCDNCDVFVLRDDGTLAPDGEEGELCVRGSFVIPGYYNNPEKTAEVFVQNPLNDAYPEIVYRTGDIVKYNENGELIYIGRKDFQIKHMGYRIELGEIENAAVSAEGVREVCCVYDSEKSMIVLVYDGNGIEAEELKNHIKAKVPQYMVPEIVFRTDYIPHNANGKIDRKFIRDNYSEMKE